MTSVSSAPQEGARLGAGRAGSVWRAAAGECFPFNLPRRFPSSSSLARLRGHACFCEIFPPFRRRALAGPRLSQDPSSTGAAPSCPASTKPGRPRPKAPWVGSGLRHVDVGIRRGATREASSALLACCCGLPLALLEGEGTGTRPWPKAPGRRMDPHAQPSPTHPTHHHSHRTETMKTAACFLAALGVASAFVAPVPAKLARCKCAIPAPLGWVERGCGDVGSVACGVCVVKGCGCGRVHPKAPGLVGWAGWILSKGGGGSVDRDQKLGYPAMDPHAKPTLDSVGRSIDWVDPSMRRPRIERGPAGGHVDPSIPPAADTPRGMGYTRMQNNPDQLNP